MNDALRPSPAKKPPFWGSRSLSKELAISLILLLVLFQGILLAYVYSRQSRFLMQELEKKADDLAANLSAVLVVPLWDFDDEQIGKIGMSLLKNDVVDEVHIKNAAGATLFRALEGSSAHGRIQRSVNVIYKNQVIGQAELFFSLGTYKRDLTWFRNTILAVLLGSLIMILVTTGILLRIFMRHPLTILQKGIDRVAKGDYGYGFEEIHHRELSGIAARFKEMAAGIEARERALQVINKELQSEIAERKHAESRIRESEARSRALLDAMPDMMFHLDRDGVLLDFKGTREDLQMSPENFLGKGINRVMPADIATMILTKIEQVLSTRRIQIFEYQLPVRSQTTYFECRMVAFSEDTVLALVRNITESKEAAADKLRLEQQLRKAQKMEAIGTLAGGVAHDLNNVLSGLVSYPELILLDLADDSPLRQSILTIQKSGEKAANIVQDLLTLARRGVSVSQVVNLNHIIMDYLKSPEYERLNQYYPQIKIDVNLEPDLLQVKGSPVHLSKTIMNLVSNAAEAMPDSGTVCIASHNRYIDKPIRGYDDIQEGDYVILKVRDTGVGIAEKDLERIFEPFYTKKAMGRSGTGLGMAVVWGTVKDHNGYIDVHSIEGQGTEFSIYLPACRQSLTVQQTQLSMEDYRGRGEFVLVVDDIEEQRAIACDILTRLGYRVDSVASGEQAVDYLKDHRTDLVVLDMIMNPGIDGLETYKRIIRYHPRQKAIIASGFSESERVKEAQALGVGAYVKKPYLMEKIAVAIRQELDRTL